MQVRQAEACDGSDRPRHIVRLIVVMTALGMWAASTLYVSAIYVLAPRSTERSDEAPPPLRVDPASLDFGVVWNSDAFRWTLPIQNTSGATIDVRKAEGSCACTEIRPKSFALKPNERLDLTLSLNLASRVSDLDRSTAPFQGSIIAKGSDDAPIATWTVKGLVKSAFCCRPRELDFGETLIVGAHYPSRTVDVTCYEPCRELVASVDPHLGAAVISNVTGDGKQFRIEVAPSAALGVGLHKFQVAVSAVLRSGERVPAVPVSIEARILDDLRILPA